MGKLFKNIPIFFIWLAWLILSAHLIVPHDHHITDPITEQDAKCPFNGPQADNHKGLPLHCHAFNDLKAREIVKHIFKENVENEVAGYNYDHKFQQTYFEYTFTGFDFHNKPFTSLFFLDFFPLRAPPVLA